MSLECFPAYGNRLTYVFPEITILVRYKIMKIDWMKHGYIGISTFLLTMNKE